MLMLDQFGWVWFCWRLEQVPARLRAPSSFGAKPDIHI